MTLLIFLVENNLQSDVKGQGRTSETSVTLSNMKPFTDYEVMIVSFKKELTSKPKVMHKFTSMNRFF